MTGINNQQLFNSLTTFSSNEISYHSISTDNIYMAELGLSVFTLNQLYEWMSYRDFSGKFVNLQFLSGVDFSPLKPEETIKSRIFDPKLGNKILGMSQTGQGTGAFSNAKIFFDQWQKRGRTGEYAEIRCDQWKNGDYQFTDVSPGRFIGAKVKFDFNNDKIEIEGSPTIDSLISALVAMNDYSMYLTILPDFYANPSSLSKDKLAVYEFIADIKTSKEKCIRWSAEIDFVVPFGDYPCTKREKVDFKLHLYDFINPKDSNRTVALNGDNLYLSLPRRDIFGRYSLNDGTGSVIIPDPSDTISNKAVAQLQLSVNPSTGLAQAGSPSVLVKLATNLPAASQSNVSEADLVTEELNPLKAHAPGFGYAVPMQEQNGNPLQWSSQYERPRCKEDEPTVRFKVPVQNHSKRAFPSGTMGFASQLMGSSWWAFAPIDEVEDQPIIPDAPKNWSFTYLMMNFDNFFASANPYRRYSTTAYEAAVYNYYYKDRLDSSTPIETGILNVYEPLQITSWDFLHPSIGGRRDEGHAISNTIYGFDNDGESWSDPVDIYGDRTTPFFGCVFPRGYIILNEKYQEYRNGLKKPIVPINTGISPVPFAVPISSGTKVFNNIHNDVDNNETKKGLFFLQGTMSNTLNHLPADIALNAAPNNQFIGSPIVSHRSIHNAFALGDYFNQKIDLLIGESGYKNRCTWMSYGEKETDSAFNFTPIDPFYIQFRPLKHEVYDAFPKTTSDNTVPPFFSNQALLYHGSNTSPIEPNSINRLSDVRDAIRVGSCLRYNAALLNADSLKKDARAPHIWRQDRAPEGLKSWLLPENRSSGAVGVIGASCAITAFKTITFDTNFLIGMPSNFGAGILLGGGAFDGLFGGGGTISSWHTAYGGDGNSFSSFNTTNLFVRIYQHWPKEYTIYDPAKFAVFHFNTESSELEYSSYDEPDNTLIFSDYVGNGLKSLTEIPQYDRKKKLLPHTYTIKKSIGIDISTVYIRNELNLPFPNPSFYAMVIDNQGEGYQNGDTFKVSGGKGVSPILEAITQDGKIIGFTYKESNNKGYNYKQSDFLPRSSDFLVENGGLRIIPYEVNGKNFQGRVVRGIITDSPELVDEKPKSIGAPFIQLVPNIPTVDAVTREIVEPFSGSNKVTVSIEAASVSSDNLYDLFFHFHNDTSHTLTKLYVGTMGRPVEQFVDLKITPN